LAGSFQIRSTKPSVDFKEPAVVTVLDYIEILTTWFLSSQFR